MLKKSIIMTMLALSCYTAIGAQDTPAVYLTEDASRTGSMITYPYKAESQVTVLTKIGYVTDIVLGKGEKITNIIAGDTARWKVLPQMVNGQAHLYVKPLVEGINTNLVITTNSYVYRIMLWSDTGTYNSVVSFFHAAPVKAIDLHPTKVVDKPVLDKEWDVVYEQYQNDTKRYDVQFDTHYVIQSPTNIPKEICPLQAFSDGTRTFIKMPSNKLGNYPVFYVVEGPKHSLELANYRVRGHYMIIDRIFTEGRLYYDTERYVTISHKDVVKEAKP